MGSLKSERIDSTETTILANHTQSSFLSKYVLFLTEKPFPSCLLATSLVFFFFINSTFNLCPGVIPCITGVIFFGVFQANEDKRETSEERFSRRSCLSLLARFSLALASLKNLKKKKKPSKHRRSCRPQLELKEIALILLVSKRPRNRILGGRLGLALLQRV